MDKDALTGFDWGSVGGGGGLFLKWEAGKPITLRVLTVDPVVATDEYEDKATGEVTLTTKFNFIVYNFTDGKAQILSATPNMARKIGEFHADLDLTGGNIKTVDIRISPTGEKLNRRYDIQVLPKARDMTADQIKEAATINLDDKVKGGSRMSIWHPDNAPKDTSTVPLQAVPANIDEVVEVDVDEVINLDDIPF
jgi:hypothetical protein